MTSRIADNLDVKHFSTLYSLSKEKLRYRYCVMFLHLHYTMKSLVVTTCNSWGFCASCNDSITNT